jgi:Domain of unknown function (DUF4062)
MPKTETILKIFVSSPNDVANEKSAVVEAVEETNRTWSDFLGVRMEAITCESHCRPGIGDDAQQVINGQLPDYDIYLGILWQRFGTSTSRFGSGTEEEFEIAYKKYKENPADIGILFYFKDEPIHPSKTDPAQLVKVQEFQKKLGPKGILYWGFESIGEFRQLVRIHLSKELQKHTSKSASNTGNIPDLESLKNESEKQAYALFEIISTHYAALEEHEKLLETVDGFEDFLNATDLLCDRLEPTVGAFARHVTKTVEAWINEFIALILTKAATSDLVNSYLDRVLGISKEFSAQSERYAHHLDVPEDVLKDGSEEAQAVIEIFRELELRQGELFQKIGKDLAIASDILSEAARVIELLNRRTANEVSKQFSK